MPKYGWFKTNGIHANVEYEGDFMKMDKEYVQIFRSGTLENPRGELIAAIRLDKGQDVRELK